MPTAVNWTRWISDMDDAFESEGATVDVLLRDGGGTFSVKMMRRKIPTENLTDGLQQNSELVSVMASRWFTGAGVGREPEKGDQITWQTTGRRQAIQVSTAAMGGEDVIGFRLTVLG